MDFYEQLPVDSLIALYHEKVKNIENGLLGKNMYYELGLMISAASKRGITLGKTDNSEQGVEHSSNDFVPLAGRYAEIKDASVSSYEV